MDLDRSSKYSPKHMDIPSECNETASVLREVNPNLNDRELIRRLEERAEIGSFAMSAGALKSHKGKYILDSQTRKDCWSIDSEEISKDGTKRIRKWVKHHHRPRKALFAPTGTQNGPNLKWVRHERITQILEDSNFRGELQDDWSVAKESHRKIPEKWVGKTIFKEEVPLW